MDLTNTDAEMMLVATAILRPSHWHELSYVSPEDFSDINARGVWRVVGEFIHIGRHPDPNNISMALYGDPSDQKACRGFLSECVSNCVSSINGPEYASIVKELSDRRKLRDSAKDILSLAEDTSCGKNAAEIASQGINRILQDQLDCLDFVRADKIGSKIIDDLDKEIPCFPTGFNKLDDALGGGFYQGRFYGIGARMKAGKSMFMASIAYKMVFSGTRILYLCLEMGAEESMQRIFSIHMGINSMQFLKKNVRSQSWFKLKLQEANQTMKNVPLFFRSRPRMTLDDLRATVSRAAMSGKIDGIIVDYMQLVEGKRKDQSSAEHYDNVAQTLAEAVKRHPIWILSAAQLNKEGNIRGSEGLLMACDMAFSLNKKEGVFCEGGSRIPDRAWIETMVSRYTPYSDIGTEEVPGYEIDTNNGPRFIEL